MVLILIFRKSFHGRMSRLTGKGSTWRKKRKEPDRDRIEGAVWIFTEGEKTEPNYLKGLISRICSDPQYRRTYHLVPCKGSGITVFSKALGYLKKIISDEMGDIYIVFDKDDIHDAVFDGLISDIEARSDSKWHWHAIWSNECFELWYVLHFEYLCADVGRKTYYSKLDKYMQKNGKKAYDKSSEDIYDLLREIGSPADALVNAERLEDKWKGYTPSKSIPCTRIRELLIPLLSRLPSDEREKFS